MVRQVTARECKARAEGDLEGESFVIMVVLHRRRAECAERELLAFLVEREGELLQHRGELWRTRKEVTSVSKSTSNKDVYQRQGKQYLEDCCSQMTGAHARSRLAHGRRLRVGLHWRFDLAGFDECLPVRFSCFVHGIAGVKEGDAS